MVVIKVDIRNSTRRVPLIASPPLSLHTNTLCPPSHPFKPITTVHHTPPNPTKTSLAQPLHHGLRRIQPPRRRRRHQRDSQTLVHEPLQHLQDASAHGTLRDPTRARTRPRARRNIAAPPAAKPSCVPSGLHRPGRYAHAAQDDASALSSTAVGESDGQGE